MAKISKKALKGLIKECLVEILIDGIDNSSAEKLFEAVDREPVVSRQQSVNRKPAASSQKQRNILSSKKPPKKQAVNEEAINGLTTNPVMADIFRDTAATTLASQGMSNSGSSRQHIPADAAAQVVSESDPMDLFEGGNNWADLAFASGKSK